MAVAPNPDSIELRIESKNLVAPFYLGFITIVWVLLWDPIEKLLFDAYRLKSRIVALEKLGRASIQFSSLSEKVQ